jgi:hypothetical protein
MADEPKKIVGFPILKIRLHALIANDPVVTKTAAAVASVLLDELRGADQVVRMESKEIGRRIDRGRRQTSEAIGILDGRWIVVRRRKHWPSEYSFPLLTDPAALNERYNSMLQDVRNSARQDERKSAPVERPLERADARISAHDDARNSASECADFRTEGSPKPIYSQGAHRLLERLAVIAGLDRHSVTWPPEWRLGRDIVQGWLGKGWSPSLIERVAKKAMRSRRNRPARHGPPDTPAYFEKAIEQELSRKTANPSAAPVRTELHIPAGKSSHATRALADLEARKAAKAGVSEMAIAALQAPIAGADEAAAAAFTGPHILRVEKWGRTAGLAPGEARDLVAELLAACRHFPESSAQRETHFGQLFDIAGRKYGVTDREKIEWLRGQIPKLKADPMYWPRERPEIRDRTRRDRILKLIKAAPGQQADIAYLMRKTGWTRDAVVNLTRRLCDDGELVRVAPGVFTLRGLGASHVSAREQILAFFDAAPPDAEYKTVELAEKLGRTRLAIDGALHGHGALVRDGMVICVRRGVFKRAPTTREATA